MGRNRYEEVLTGDSPLSYTVNGKVNVTDDTEYKLTERQRLILHHLKATGQVDVTENVTINVTENVTSLAVRFKVTERTIKRDLKALQTLGVIKHDGPNNGGRWIVI